MGSDAHSLPRRGGVAAPSRHAVRPRNGADGREARARNHEASISGQFGAIFSFAGLLLRLRPIGLALRAAPSAPIKEAWQYFIMSRPPLLCEEGNSCLSAGNL